METTNKTFANQRVSLVSNVPEKFALAVKEHHEKHNVKLVKYANYRNYWISVEVVGTMDDLVALNKECEDVAYGDDNESQYIRLMNQHN